MFCDIPPAMALIEAGKMRALGVTTSAARAGAAEMPPLAEVGIPGYDTASWHTIATTAHVPRTIVDKLSATSARAWPTRSVSEALARTAPSRGVAAAR